MAISLKTEPIGRRYPKQLVSLVDDETDAEVRAVARVSRLRLSELMREIIKVGLPIVRERLTGSTAVVSVASTSRRSSRRA